MTSRRSDPQIDQAAELKAWRMTFKSGYDYLRALPAIGVNISERHQPAREATEDAWRRLGRAFLDARGQDADMTWAEREFGLPERLTSPRLARRRR